MVMEGKQLNSWWNFCIQRPTLMGLGKSLLPEEWAMAKRRTSEVDCPAEQLAEDIRAQANDIVREVAEFLNSVPDEQLFGDNEFIVRQKVLKIVAAAYTARVAQKKTARSVRASTARSAGK